VVPAGSAIEHQERIMVGVTVPVAAVASRTEAELIVGLPRTHMS
jgi:hypothetical protein